MTSRRVPVWPGASARRLATELDRAFPWITPREWAAIAVAAGRRAGLEQRDLKSLRGRLADQLAINEAKAISVRLRPGDTVQLPEFATGGGTGIVEEARYQLIPSEIVVVFRRGRRVMRQTIPADLLQLVARADPDSARPRRRGASRCTGMPRTMARGGGGGRQ